MRGFCCDVMRLFQYSVDEKRWNSLTDEVILNFSQIQWRGSNIIKFIYYIPYFGTVFGWSVIARLAEHNSISRGWVSASWLSRMSCRLVYSHGTQDIHVPCDRRFSALGSFLAFLVISGAVVRLWSWNLLHSTNFC